MLTFRNKVYFTIGICSPNCCEQSCVKTRMGKASTLRLNNYYPVHLVSIKRSPASGIYLPSGPGVWRAGTPSDAARRLRSANVQGQQALEVQVITELRSTHARVSPNHLITFSSPQGRSQTRHRPGWVGFGSLNCVSDPYAASLCYPCGRGEPHNSLQRHVPFGHYDGC